MSFQEHEHPPKPVLSVPEQIEWCYREHTVGQQAWLGWAKRLRRMGRGREVPTTEWREAA
jgi:hypothetical protein